MATFDSISTTLTAAEGAEQIVAGRQLLTKSVLLGIVPGLISTLLAVTGIRLIRVRPGLVQYSVASRTREIGLRQAIGAQPGDIFRMIIGEGLMLSLTGLALGLVGVLAVGRLGSSLLFGVTAADPLTFTTVSVLLTAVATAASYVPARRAMTVEPMAALRAT